MDIQKIEEIFNKNLQKYKNDFGFVCFFGNVNSEHDLDVFIAPSKKIKKGAFLKKLVDFFAGVRNELQKENSNLLIIWHSTYEEEVEYINTKKNAIKIHVSSFPDVHPVPIPNYLACLKKAEKVLLGDYKAIEEMEKTKLDFFYNYLFISNCLLSNYPRGLEKKKISEKVDYVYKHLINKKRKLIGSPKKQFFECCDFVDKRAY